MTGTVKTFDPINGFGSLVRQTDLQEFDFARDAFELSGFRFLRQGQTLSFDLNEDDKAINLRFGSEGDMKTPEHAPPGLVAD